MTSLRRLRSCLFDNGPRSEIREGDLANMRRKYVIHPSVGKRSPTEFERAPNGGAGEVSSFFGFCPSQLTPLTWRTLMAIQVLGELHGFSVGVHEILYSYYFAPLANKEGFYHLRSRDGAPLVEEPSRGVRGNHPFGISESRIPRRYPFSHRRSVIFLWFLSFSTYSSDLEDFNGHPKGFYHLRSRDGAPLVEEPSRGVRGNHPFGDSWNSRYVFVKIQEPVGYPTSWRTVDVSRLVSFAGEAVAKLIMGVPRRFRWVTFLMIREALRHSRVCGNMARLPVSVVYDEYQKVKARKRHLSYTPPPRLARAALSANGLSSISSTSAEIFPNRDLLVDAYRKLTGEVFLLRSLVLGYFCVQAIHAQLYGMIGGRRRVVECILLLR
ncbi:hypothetical protein DY000_02040902 [Brassica cretica]|uniref:Uncharacterized protein n=1 Tax=Brassica cretica TaxID=69181 RepID=A0ABQ7BCX5_BRACR|nr:hypothetical protein DY000_02040902 [Brassica cretica]